MTFDEAIKKARTDLIYDDNAWGVWTELLEDLKQEYAPTIDITQEQYDVLAELDIDIIKQILLHPETVNIVDKEQL